MNRTATWRCSQAGPSRTVTCSDATGTSANTPGAPVGASAESDHHTSTMSLISTQLTRPGGRRGRGRPRRPTGHGGLNSLRGRSIFVYALGMGGDEVSSEQIQVWVEEAEAGYDIEALKRRGRGRPGRGVEPMQVVAVRLTADEIAALDAMAARDHISTSEAIRRALAAFAA